MTRLMKCKMVFFFVLLTPLSAFAQGQETLIKEVRSVGIFGGPMVEIGQINGEWGADLGGGGALMLNQFFFGGYGLGTDYPQVELDGTSYNLRFRHGGFWLGYTSDPARLVHFYGSTRLGRGKAEIRGSGPAVASDRIYVVTPELGLEVNLTEWLRLALSGGYRWTTGVSRLDAFDDATFSSPIGTLTLRFGGFVSDDMDW